MADSPSDAEVEMSDRVGEGGRATGTLALPLPGLCGDDGGCDCTVGDGDRTDAAATAGLMAVAEPEDVENFLRGMERIWKQKKEKKVHVEQSEKGYSHVKILF